MFLKVSVILFTGRGVPGPGVCLVLGGCAWSQGVPDPGGVGLVLGGCLVLGVPGPGGRGVSGPGGCLVWGVPGGVPPQTATAVGGTHPTRMHSCLKDNTKYYKGKHFTWYVPRSIWFWPYYVSADCTYKGHISIKEIIWNGQLNKKTQNSTNLCLEGHHYCLCLNELAR